MISDRLERARARSEEHLVCGDHPASVLARRESGHATPADEERAAELAAELEAAQDPDGSWRGDLVATAEVLLQLHDLAPSGREPGGAVARGLQWLRDRRGAPGRFGEDCAPERHALGLCHHFLGGLFAPAHDGEVALASGARIPAGPAARLAASCIALRCVLRWGWHGPDVRLHLDALRRIVAIEPRRTGGPFPVEAVAPLLSALLEAPRNEENAAALRRGLGRILQMQRADGSWPELDAFPILETLLIAAERGEGSATLDAALQRSANLLAITQQGDGTWEREKVPQRTLIGWRTLRYALRAEERTAGA